MWNYDHPHQLQRSIRTTIFNEMARENTTIGDLISSELKDKEQYITKSYSQYGTHP